MRTAPLHRICALAAALFAAALPLGAQAHRAWMMPSSTILSGNEPSITVDAAVSDELFYFDHNPLNLDGLVVSAPDGSPVALENQSKGRFRSTFDLKLAQTGTYRLAVVGDSLNASYRLNGETRRVRGTAESLAKDIPAGAETLGVSRMQSRTEVFVTSGKPSHKALQPTRSGLELVPVTHPNDLVSGEAATFRLLLDGQPAAGIEVTVVPGGIRYRDKLGDFKATADAQGQFSVTWPVAGMYYLTATHGALPRPSAAADGKAPQVPAGTLQQPLRRASYSATLEVLPR